MGLKTKHFFPFIKLIKALDIKNEFKEMYSKAKGKTEEELEELDKTEGLDYMFMLIEKLPNAEKETFNFLSVYTGKSKEDIEEMEIDEIAEVIKTVLMDEKLQVFFQQAMKQMK